MTELQEDQTDGRGARYAGILVAALCIVRGPKDTVTFVHQRHGPFAGHWLLPGGGVELGEPVAETARREAKEETGIEPADISLSAVYEIMGRWPDTDRSYHLLMSCFLAAGTHRFAPGFEGDNVDAVAQLPLDGSIPLHCTDYVILADAGVLPDTPEDNRRRLAADGIFMSRIV